MSTFRRVVEEKQLTVADLIAVLRKFPGDLPVEATCAWPDCQEPGGPIVSVGVLVDDHVEIVGERYDPPGAHRHTPTIYPTA